MNTPEYESEVARLMSRGIDAYPEECRWLDREWQGAAVLRVHDRLIWALGLAGEAGEVCDLLKKVNGHGKPYDAEKLKLELGDVLWYVAAIALGHGFSLDELMVANVSKLRARYKDGFSVAAAAAKADEFCPTGDP
jgi:NTP pyrophosphatase (non-canonical NTP hydrolase)